MNLRPVLFVLMGVAACSGAKNESSGSPTTGSSGSGSSGSSGSAGDTDAGTQQVAPAPKQARPKALIAKSGNRRLPGQGFGIPYLDDLGRIIDKLGSPPYRIAYPAPVVPIGGQDGDFPGFCANLASNGKLVCPLPVGEFYSFPFIEGQADIVAAYHVDARNQRPEQERIILRQKDGALVMYANGNSSKTTLVGGGGGCDPKLNTAREILQIPFKNDDINKTLTFLGYVIVLATDDRIYKCDCNCTPLLGDTDTFKTANQSRGIRTNGEVVELKLNDTPPAIGRVLPGTFDRFTVIGFPKGCGLTTAGAVECFAGTAVSYPSGSPGPFVDFVLEYSDTYRTLSASGAITRAILTGAPAVTSFVDQPVLGAAPVPLGSCVDSNGTCSEIYDYKAASEAAYVAKCEQETGKTDAFAPKACFERLPDTPVTSYCNGMSFNIDGAAVEGAAYFTQVSPSTAKAACAAATGSNLNWRSYL